MRTLAQYLKENNVTGEAIDQALLIQKAEESPITTTPTLVGIEAPVAEAPAAEAPCCSDECKAEIIDILTEIYTAEVETVLNYLAISVTLDGAVAETIKTALAADVAIELGHGTAIANRIKELGGEIPGSLTLDFGQDFLQPPEESTDILAVVEGVIEAEQGAIALYNAAIKACEGCDYATQDLCIQNLKDEEAHRTEFEGFLKELEG